MEVKSTTIYLTSAAFSNTWQWRDLITFPCARIVGIFISHVFTHIDDRNIHFCYRLHYFTCKTNWGTFHKAKCICNTCDAFNFQVSIKHMRSTGGNGCSSVTLFLLVAKLHCFAICNRLLGFIMCYGGSCSIGFMFIVLMFLQCLVQCRMWLHQWIYAY